MMTVWAPLFAIYLVIAPIFSLRSLYISSAAPHRGITSHSDSENFFETYNRILPCIVFIETFKEDIDPLTSKPYRRPLGTGSGFVYDQNGHIVTNFHVINKAKEVEVLFKNGAFQGRWKAELVGSDTDTDIAVLNLTEKVPGDSQASLESNSPENAEGYPEKTGGTHKKTLESPTCSLPLGDSKNLKIGERVYALGNPYGLHQSLTSGIISGLNREIKAPSGRSMLNLIQTDAAINPGNSGGPLVNTKGQAIGMNTAIKSPSGGSAGVGFAIPIDEVISVANEIINDGKTTKTRLGLTLLNENNELERNFRISGYAPPEGILIIDSSKLNYLKGEHLISSTRRNENTGEVILGDFLYKIGEEKVTSLEQIQKILKKYKPGDILILTVHGSNLNEKNEYTKKKVKIRLISSQSDP